MKGCTSREKTLGIRCRRRVHNPGGGGNSMNIREVPGELRYTPTIVAAREKKEM